MAPVYDQQLYDIYISMIKQCQTNDPFLQHFKGIHDSPLNNVSSLVGRLQENHITIALFLFIFRKGSSTC